MSRRCPFCNLELLPGDRMFLRLVPKGFFVFEHMVRGQRYCQRALKNTTTVEAAQRIMVVYGIAGGRDEQDEIDG